MRYVSDLGNYMLGLYISTAKIGKKKFKRNIGEILLGEV